MGDCCSRTVIHKFHPVFHAHLTVLYDYYLTVVKYVRDEQLFAERTPRLEGLVETYLKEFQESKIENSQIGKENQEICAIDMAHKLHPMDYGTSTVTKQWLMDACLRQQRFISEFPLEQINFQASFRHYVQFLYICFVSEGEVIVPSKMADFMWHAHMQDHEGYRSDLQKMLGRVLDHVDDFSEEDLREYARKTEQIRTKLSKFMDKNVVMLPRPPVGEGEDGAALYGKCGINCRGICGAGESGLALPSKMWKHGGVNCGATCGVGGGGGCGGACGGASCGS